MDLAIADPLPGWNVRAFIATSRNRIEAVNDPLKDRFPLETHRAKPFWGRLTRTATQIATYPFAKRWPLDLILT